MATIGLLDCNPARLKLVSVVDEKSNRLDRSYGWTLHASSVDPEYQVKGNELETGFGCDGAFGLSRLGT